jgi:hypothetical protein
VVGGSIKEGATEFHCFENLGACLVKLKKHIYINNMGLYILHSTNRREHKVGVLVEDKT